MMPGYQPKPTTGPLPPPINPEPTSLPARPRLAVWMRELATARQHGLRAALAFHDPAPLGVVLVSAELFAGWIAAGEGGPWSLDVIERRATALHAAVSSLTYTEADHHGSAEGAVLAAADRFDAWLAGGGE